MDRATRWAREKSGQPGGHGPWPNDSSVGLYEHGILSLGMGWQVPRLPGLGDVDWPAFFSALYRSGDDHVCCVEHEDRQWEGSDELLKRGFLLARDVLKPYLH
jgi:sugar phosphate isomerase/epimerase